MSPDKSRAEIERTLQRYGADQFMYGWDEVGQALVAFRMNGRHVRLLLPLPRRDAREFTHTPERGYQRREEDAIRAWEQGTRQRWRALALVVKAKLEAVEAGISTFEREFLSDVMLPDGRTVHEWLEPQIEEAYAGGSMPASLRLALPRGDD